MSTKGTLTFITEDRFGGKHRSGTKVFWMDGYDAWLAIFSGRGEKNRRTSKQTSYGFTVNSISKIIKGEYPLLPRTYLPFSLDRIISCPHVNGCIISCPRASGYVGYEGFQVEKGIYLLSFLVLYLALLPNFFLHTFGISGIIYLACLLMGLSIIIAILLNKAGLPFVNTGKNHYRGWR